MFALSGDIGINALPLERRNSKDRALHQHEPKAPVVSCWRS